MWTHQIESPIAPARLFRASMDEWHVVGPKAMPEIITGAEILSGDGEASSVRQINFTSAMPYKYMKDRLDFIDHEKLECKSTMIEGGDLGKKFESASFHFKFEPAGTGACVVKVEADCKPIRGVAVDKDEVNEGVTAIIKGAEAYLLANPNAYVA